MELNIRVEGTNTTVIKTPTNINLKREIQDKMASVRK